MPVTRGGDGSCKSNDAPRLAVKRELIKDGLLVKPGSGKTDVSVWWVTLPACWSSRGNGSPQPPGLHFAHPPFFHPCWLSSKNSEIEMQAEFLSREEAVL